MYEELLKELIREKGGTPEDYRRILNLISFHETGGTMDPSTIQRSDKSPSGEGPGRGKYQLEGDPKINGFEKSSNRLLTSANRTANYYKELGKPVPEIISRIQSGDIYDATQLHPEIQDILVLGDLRMKGGLDLKDYISGKLAPEDLWVDHWWSGSQEKRPEQREKFVKDMKLYDASIQNPQSKQIEVATEKPVKNSYGQDFTQSLNLFRYGGNMYPDGGGINKRNTDERYQARQVQDNARVNQKKIVTPEQDKTQREFFQQQLLAEQKRRQTDIRPVKNVKQNKKSIEAAKKATESQLTGERPLIYLANPLKIAGDALETINPGGRNFDLPTSEEDRQRIMWNRYNPNQSSGDRFSNHLSQGLDYVPEATINTAIGAAFAKPNIGSILNYSTNPLAGTNKNVVKGLRKTGKYLTTQTPLKNTYKLNPWAFKPNPEAYYRGIGRKGVEDALQSGVIKSRDTDLFPSPYFARPNEFETALYYNPEALVEAKGIDVSKVKSINNNNLIFKNKDAGAVPLNPEYVDEVYLENTTPGFKQSSLKDIPISNPNIKLLQKDWLKGYKEVKPPTASSTNTVNKNFKSEIDWAKWNKEIPNNKTLIDEYNTIEATTKKAGTWMKNPDGSAFKGTPEQFVQQNSENFKKAFPEGFENVWRGVKNWSSSDVLRPERAVFTADEKLAGKYTKGNKILTYDDNFLKPTTKNSDELSEGVFNLAHKKSSNNIELNFNKDHWNNLSVKTKEALLSDRYTDLQEYLRELKLIKKYEPDSYSSLTDYAKQRIKENRSIISNQRNSKGNDSRIVNEIKNAIGSKVSTDDLAKYIEDKNIDFIKLNNIHDGWLGDVSIVNHKKGNYLKSLVGNNGMFDMTNPNIYKALIPAAVATGAAAQSENEQNQLKLGGNLTNQNTMNDINMFNEGGTHESNPMGGIPQGMGENGQPNTVEEGEGRMGDMIYSDRIPLTEEAIMAVGLPKKFAGKTPAQALAEIEKTFKDRGDRSAQETKKDFADKIAQAQEMIKEQQAQIDQAMAANAQEVPDQMGGQIPSGMEEFMQPEQGGLPMEQDGRLQTGMQEQPQMFRRGGRMNRYFGGGPIDVNMQSEDMSGINFGQTGVPGIGSMLGVGTTALDFGNQIFGKSGVDTSGKTNYQERFKSGPGIASNALKGASAGSNFGPWGAAGGTVLGGVAGIIGGNKKKRDLKEAERNNTLIDTAQMRSDFKYGGKITDLIQKQFEKPTGNYMDYNRTSKEKDFWDEDNKNTAGFINSMLVPNKEKDFWDENSDSLGFLNSMIVPSKNNNFKYGGKVNKYRYGGDPNDPRNKSYYPEVDNPTTPSSPMSSPTINPSMQIEFPNQGYYSTPDGKTQGQNPNSIFNTGNLDKAGRIGNSLLRGAPVGMNLLQLKDAGKYDKVNAIKNTNRFNPQYIDEKSLQNIADQSMNKTINSISEMGGSKGQMISNIKDIGKNRAETLGKSYLDSRYKNIQTDTFGQQFDNQNTEANIARQIGAEDRTAMNKGQAATNKSRLLSQIGNDLGNIGKENMYKEIAKITGYNWLGEYLKRNPNASPEEVVAEAQKHVAKEEPTTNAGAYGGKLKLKKILIMSNRYTQITPSAYNPMSLQEIMMAPTIQRRQHDDTNQQIQDYLASLSKIDPHDKHWEEAQAEKQRLIQELDKNASTLAQKGFSPDITDSIMKFNRDYQDTISPTGKLGQIQAEHANIKAQEENFRKNYAPTYGGDRADEILIEEMEKYEKEPSFDDKGRIIPYKPRQLSKYISYVDEFDKLATKAGLTANEWKIIRSGLEQTEDGRIQYVGTTTKGGSRSDNKEQIEAVENFINRQLLNPNSEMHKSLIDQGKTVEEALGDIDAMMGIYKKEAKSSIEGDQWSNLMESNKGKDKVEPFMNVYANSNGTYGFVKDFNALSGEVEETLENPEATPIEKAKARDTKKLIQDIDNELSDPESPHYDPSYVEGVALENEILESFSTDNLREMFKTTISPHSFSESVNQVDVPEGNIRVFYQMKDPKDGKQYDVNKVISNEEYGEIQETFGKSWLKINDVRKHISRKRDERLNQHAYEEIRYPTELEKSSDKTLQTLNFFRGTNINNIIPQHINVTSKGIPETVDFKDDDRLKLVTTIRRASNDEIKSIIPTEVGRQAGFNVEIAFNKNNESAEELDLNGELVNVFIPINTSTEQLTGYEESSMMNLSSLPESLQGDFKKMIDTQHISSTRNKEDLGQNAIPGESILGKTFEGGGEIDFLENKSKNSNENYVSMYGRVDQYGDFRPMSWESIIRYDILDEDSENANNYVKIIASSGIKETLKKTAKKYKSINENQTLYDVFNLGSENGDWSGLLKELRHREIRLPHTRDVYEISRLKAREQYE